MRMGVLAINGSPKGEKSNTMLILQPFLEGLEGDGASTELVQVRDLEVRTCDGDYFCWAKKPGVCRYHDAMEEMGIEVQDVFEAAREAGRALAKTGNLPKEEVDRVARPLMAKEDYLRVLNTQFERALGKS